MNIGLWDDDVEYYFPMIFNLELMKISSYYKKKREIVTYMPSRNVFKSIRPQRL